MNWPNSALLLPPLLARSRVAPLANGYAELRVARKTKPMKPISWIGLVVLVLGVLSLLVPIPHKEREGFSAGGLSMGVETQHSQTVSPIISAVMILGGAGMMIAGKGRK